MYRLKQITLFLGDWVMLVIGLYLATLIRYLSVDISYGASLIAPMIPLFLIATIILFIVGLYDINQTKNNSKLYKKILLSSCAWFVIGIVYFYLKISKDVAPKTILLLVSVSGFGLICLWRYVYNRYISTNIWQINIIFVGYTPEVKELIKIFNKEPQRGYVVKGIVANIDEHIEAMPGIIIENNIEKIKEQNKYNGQTLVILTQALEKKPELLKELYKGIFEDMGVINMVDLFEDITGRIPPFAFSENYFISNLQEQNKKIYDRLKMLFDFVCAFLIAIFFAITFPFVFLAIKINSKGPIFFKQKRIGKNEVEFVLYKYRTMKALSADGSAEINGQPQFASNEDDRITVVGKFLRKTRLDEIPQFINILKRQMSMIGPRPERPQYVNQLLQTMPYYALRHLIRPGLTGWAQIKHGYTDNINENLKKLEYDLHYVKNRGPLIDISIILRTINTIIRLTGK